MSARQPSAAALPALVGGVAAILAVGTFGYVLIEGWSWMDAFYMTVITVATVGFGETNPLSPTGRWFTVGLIFAGVGWLGYSFAEVTAFLAAGGWQAFASHRRNQKMLATITGHTIVCGAGRLGSALIDELQRQKVSVAVVDRDEAVVEHFLRRGLAAVHGDAGDDHVLLQAGVVRAHALVAALDDDANNVFTVLTARGLCRSSNPGLVIHGRADDPDSMRKLVRAGANHAFCPAHDVGHRVAHQIVHPTITELVGLHSRGATVELGIEELSGGRLGTVGVSLSEAGLLDRSDLVVLAVKRSDGTLVFPPDPKHVLGAGDRIVVVGRPESLDRL